MNWGWLQTYRLSSEKSFEMLCNQLFKKLVYSKSSGKIGDCREK